MRVPAQTRGKYPYASCRNAWGGRLLPTATPTAAVGTFCLACSSAIPTPPARDMGSVPALSNPLDPSQAGVIDPPLGDPLLDAATAGLTGFDHGSPPLSIRALMRSRLEASAAVDQTLCAASLAMSTPTFVAAAATAGACCRILLAKSLAGLPPAAFSSLLVPLPAANVEPGVCKGLEVEAWGCVWR